MNNTNNLPITNCSTHNTLSKADSNVSKTPIIITPSDVNSFGSIGCKKRKNVKIIQPQLKNKPKKITGNA